MAETYNIRIGGGVNQAVFASFGRLSTTLSGVTRSIAGLAALITAAFGGLQLIRFAARVIDNADELRKFSEEVGIAIDQLSKLKFAADLSGVGEQFNAGIRRFSSLLSDASVEGSKARQTFDTIGIAVVDVTGKLRPTADILNDVADRFNGWADGANKANIAQELFGTKNSRFINLLNGGSQALREQGDELDRLGGTVTPEASAQAERYNDSLTRLQALSSGLALTVASELLPEIVALIQGFTTSVNTSGALKAVIDTLIVGFRLASMAVAGFVDGIGAMARAIGKLSTGDFRGAAQEIGDVWERNVNRQLKATEEVLDLINGKTRRVSADLSKVTAQTGPDPRPDAPPLSSPGRAGGQAGREELTWARGWEDFVSSLSSTSNRVRSVFGAINAEISNISAGITQAIFITGDWGQAFRNIGLTIINTLIEIGVQQVIASALGATIRRTATAEQVSSNATIAASAAPAAATTGAATFGANAIGVALVIGAIIAGIAALSGAFAQGGFTGNVPTTSIAGVVHGREFVIPANKVDEFGAGFFESIRQGDITPADIAQGSSAATATREPMNVSFAMLKDRNDERQFMATEGWKQVVNKLNQRGNRLRV